MQVFQNRITDLFRIDIPLVQGGMIWASGWRLASAVSNAGGLGLIGSGSMYPHILLEHIQKCKDAGLEVIYKNGSEFHDMFIEGENIVKDMLDELGWSK